MLKDSDITKIVNGYIGVDSGYLVGFSYQSHKDFYPQYCDLNNIDTEKYTGTTRARFCEILKAQPPHNQALILKGILTKFPFDSFKDKEKMEKKKYYDHILELIKSLEKNLSLESSELVITSEVVQRAIDDMKTLIEKNGAISGVDRMHTTLHGYLKAICLKENISIAEKDPTLTQLFKEIRKSPKFNINCTRTHELEKILNSIANILDALNPIRNNASIAHPNELLLPEAEAYLVINAAQTVLHYINSKFKD
jgi:hypothetical protein